MGNSTTSITSVFGQRLRSCRLALGLSQEALGVAIGIDESSSRGRVSRYELGVNEPAVAISRLLAKVLNVPVAYLYCDDDLEAEALLIIHRVGAADKRQIVETLRSCLPEGL